MAQPDDSSQVNRRKILRRAVAAAGGVSAAGIVAATAASPAHAADGDAVLTGETNVGTTPTRLENSTGGSALSIKPSTAFPDIAPPAGTIFVDGVGDIAVVGDVEGVKYYNWLYSPNWAQFPVPLTPWRILDTRWPDATSDRNNLGREKVVGGISSFDSAGRVAYKSDDSPMLKLDFKDFLNPNLTPAQRTYVTVQGNFTIAKPSSGSWAAVYSGPFTKTTSLNFKRDQNVANFVQTPLDTDGTISFKANGTLIFIFTWLGIILPDFTYLGDGGSSAAAQSSSAATDGIQQDLLTRLPARRPGFPPVQR